MTLTIEIESLRAEVLHRRNGMINIPENRRGFTIRGIRVLEGIIGRLQQLASMREELLSGEMEEDDLCDGMIGLLDLTVECKENHRQTSGHSAS